MEIIFILLVLFGVKHFLADFVLQLDYMVAEKGTYFKTGGIHHALVHGLLTWWTVVWFTNPMIAFLLSALDAVIHYHVDWCKVQLSSKHNNQDPMYWVWFGADQLAHYLTYLAITAIIITI